MTYITTQQHENNMTTQPVEHPNASSTMALFERYAPDLFRFLRQHIASVEDAEDIQVEIFATVLEHTAFHDWSEDRQYHWLWRVAKNKLIDAYRKASRMEHVPLEKICDHLCDDERSIPELTVLQREAATHLDEAIRSLPPFQQRLLMWRFVYGMRCVDIADQLGKSDEAVRAQLSRTLKVLRRMYQEKKMEI